MQLGSTCLWCVYRWLRKNTFSCVKHELNCCNGCKKCRVQIREVQGHVPHVPHVPYTHAAIPTLYSERLTFSVTSVLQTRAMYESHTVAHVTDLLKRVAVPALHATCCQMIISSRCGTWLQLDCRSPQLLVVSFHFFKELITLVFSPVITYLPASCVPCASHPAIHTSTATHYNSLHALRCIGAPHHHLP